MKIRQLLSVVGISLACIALVATSTPSLATAVSSFSYGRWVGAKTPARNTPVISTNLEVALDHLPDEPVQVDLVCAITASRNDGEVPVKKVKTQVNYTFYGRYTGGWDNGNREPLGTTFSRRYKTGPEGFATWRQSAIFDSAADRPLRIGVDLRGQPLNKKKVEEHSIICELTAYVTIA